MAKKGLGRGIESLFTENSLEEINSSSTEKVKLVDIVPNKDQPRKKFNDESLSELADSILQHGVIQPLLVRPLSGGTYQLVAGERRWRASRMAGLKEVPVVIKDLSDEEASVIAMIENLQREDLNPIEEADGIKYLMIKYGLTQEEVSERVGKSRSAVANSLRLLKLPESITEYVRDGIISAGHAKSLLPLEDEEKMISLCNRIIAENLSVRETEKIVKDMLIEKKAKKKKSRDKFFDEVELSLKDSLKRKIKINSTSKNKGTITIEFFDKEDLVNFVKYFDENK
ncbi:MAG: ParB/RepB/Spo0J family partition protein [Ruminococcaceae bacterium]|nr:ParB/RepB/Spo0J family partition protein [Oscillospiraceae bacterium]